MAGRTASAGDPVIPSPSAGIDFQFIVDSDLHFTKCDSQTVSIREDKQADVKKIMQLIEQAGESNENNLSAVIVPGDLTDHGWDGSSFAGWYYGGKIDELSGVKKQYVGPIEQAIAESPNQSIVKEMKVYVGIGNHDTYVPPPYL